MSADPDPHWDIKLATFGVAFLGCFLVSLLTRLASDAAGVDVPLHIRGLAVSGLHAIVVVSTATLTFLRGDGDIGVGGEEPLLGSLGLCVSVAYFVWDVRNMLRTGYQPLVPLLMHHVISGASMSWIACCVPRAVWYTCILQMSEATVPVNNLVTLWEWRGAHDRPSYTLLRWLLLAAWLPMRLLLIAYFHVPVYREWSGMSLPMHILALNGPLLLTFNSAALAKVVLHGFPWLARKGGKGE
uniref:TLC domain-containing protein n=2 Tax=Emiliania huxleyi TaxID=2903 RepID=A0A7S3SC71_EMIHU